MKADLVNIQSNKQIVMKFKIVEKRSEKVFENRRFYNHFLEFFLLYEWGKDACNHTLRSEALQKVLHNKVKYDIILVEQFNSDCMMGVAYKLNAPVIALSSCAIMPWHYERMGMPIIPSYIPATFMGQSEEMTFGGRICNWITFHVMIAMYKMFSIPAADSFVQFKFGHDMPSVGELAKETTMMFVNQHFSLSGAKPLPPSVIELGGVHIQKSKPLDVDLQKFLDNADHGVVFISWGSMIRAETLPVSKRDAIVKAARRLKQRVIWKWENDTLAHKPDNMYISKWLPQRDILCHPNVKVFMTHAGLMGSSEAAYCGVPVVATPMYGDQFLNAAAMKQRGMGVILNYEDIDENSVIRSIKKVLERPYFDNAKIVSYGFKHRPEAALHTAIWWVEYVANTEGAPLLKSRAPQLSRFTYYSLDVYAIFAFIGLFSLITWGMLVRKIRQNINRNKTTKVKSN
ncbi:UDP-glycosyltransferase UGT5-like [Haematobia irritans]|uniref:UDP-glycosyltransferase UGT5-like n=1 Tax=Haematobia irritans TaxID=7368 RepID=UPI003F4FD12B